MIQVIILVIIVAFGYSFIRNKNKLKKKQEKRDAINIKKDELNRKLGISEKESIHDKEGNVFVLSEEDEVYIFNSNENKIDKLDKIKSIESKRRYATVKTG